MIIRFIALSLNDIIIIDSEFWHANAHDVVFALNSHYKRGIIIVLLNQGALVIIIEILHNESGKTKCLFDINPGLKFMF